MSHNVVLPALGESVTEGTVTRWLKKVGERVEVDEPLLEVSTDKVDTEIPSPISGIVEEILVAEDQTVEVGAVLARVGDGQDQPVPVASTPIESASAETAATVPSPEEPVQVSDVSESSSEPTASPAVTLVSPVEPVSRATPEVAPVAATAPPATPAPAATVPAAPASSPTFSFSAQQSAATDAGGYVTPIVRKLAAEQGVDLSRIVGTGVGGRIRKEDVLNAQPTSTAASAVAPAKLEISPLRGTSAPMSRLRKVVAERAVASMTSTAQLTSVVEVDVTNVAALRDRVKDEFFAKTGTKLNFLPFFAVAAVEALASYPIINSTIDGENIVYPAAEHLSIAVDTERGLLTPVVHNAGDLNIAQMAGRIAQLAERTRNNQLKPDELSGGTFTLTNTGSRGALFDTPVVFLPQSAILGTGVVVRRPVVVTSGGSEAIAMRSMVYLALSYDHRHIDGADAARYLSAVKARLEAGAFEAQLGI